MERHTNGEMSLIRDISKKMDQSLQQAKKRSSEEIDEETILEASEKDCEWENVHKRGDTKKIPLPSKKKIIIIIYTHKTGK